MDVVELTESEIKERLLRLLQEDRVWTIESLWRRIQFVPGYEVSFAIEDFQMSGIVDNATHKGCPIGWRHYIQYKET